MWIIYASGSALAESLCNAATRSTRDRWTVVTTAWFLRVFAALTVAILALVLHGPPPIPSASAWIPGAASIIMNAGTTLLMIRALRDSDLSLTAPIAALSPVMLLATDPLITGELMPPLGMLGACVIALGLYLLNLPTLKTHGPLGPFRAIWKERGPRMMLAVVVIWSVTAPLDRLASHGWDPLWYAASLQAGVGILLTPVWLLTSRGSGSKPWFLMLVGLGAGIASACQMTAIASVSAAYVISIKRFSAPLGVVWGRVWFHEPHFRERLIGALVMTVGAVCILLSL